METSSVHAGHPLALIGTFAILAALYAISKIVYVLYFDQLSKIPGPKLNAISRIPYARHLLNGTTVDNVVELHKKYGEVVRISPNEISFTSGETALQDIYGFRTGKHKGHENMQKDPVWYPPPPNGAKSILVADDAQHSRGRKILSHAFSAQALSEQEPLVQQYVDQLIARLGETVVEKEGETQDMTAWYNWTTFDVIADLLFGEPFGSLEERSTHEHISLLFAAMKATRLLYIKSYFPWSKYLGLVDMNIVKKRNEFAAWVHDRVQKRIQSDRQRSDFMTHILAHNGDKGATPLSDAEMASNANLLLIAGSETTATLLSGATFCLLTNPDKYEKLKQEIRTHFKSYDEITLSEVNHSPYLLAVLNEALRWFPPVPTGFERRVGKGGEFVSGYYLPEGTAVCFSHYPAYHSESNFRRADEFLPERWMGDAEFADDKRSAWQPFSFGPRNCLGKNLAYAEMRLILAKMVWSFDMELDSSCVDWVKRCKVMTLWDKPALNVRVKRVVR